MQRNRLFHSTTGRVALILMLAQIASTSLGIYLIYDFAQRTILNESRDTAAVARDDFVNDFENEGVAAMKQAISGRLEAGSDPDFVVYVRNPDGSKLVGNLRAWPGSLGEQEAWRVLSLYRDGRASPEQIGVITTPLGRGYVLLTGDSMENGLAINRTFEMAALYALALSLILSAAIAIGAALFVEKRIDLFSATAEEINRGRLATRVHLNGTGDAFDRLGLAINAMLNRIEGLVRELRMITDSMAHDLRTPVSRMKAALERAIMQTEDAAAREALSGAIDEADGLHAMLNTALEISRAEAGIGRDQFTRFAVGELLESIAEVYGPIAEDAGLKILTDAEMPIAVFAHRDMLTRAISNLVDNALKYASGATRILLAATTTADNQIELVVADDGPGIPPEQLADALKRFGRLDPARTRSGAGLGLSLVETIAHLHRGVMYLEGNVPQGLKVRLSLPIQPSE